MSDRVSEGSTTSGIPPKTNQLLAALPSAAANYMFARLKPVQLAQGQMLVTPGQCQSEVYFPTGCLASAVVRLEDGRAAEVGLIGSEGFVGLPILLETDCVPHAVMCQVPGQALRMSSTSLRTAVRRLPPVRGLLYRYGGVRLIEQAQMIACNSLHPVRPRLARWLLMAHDRLGSDRIQLTQEYLAAMLAVRRPYVNSAVQALKRSGVIHYRRGEITLLHRARLEATACEDYAVLRAEYARLLGV